MKTSIFMGVVVILFTPAILSGHTTSPPHIEPTTVQVDAGTPSSITASPSKPTLTTGEATKRALPERTSHPTVTLPSLLEDTHVTTLSPELGNVTGETRDTTFLQTTASLSTLPVFLHHHSSISPKPVSFTESSAVATSVPPEKGITHTELITTPAISTNQTQSNDTSTKSSASTPAPLVPDQTTSQSTASAVTSSPPSSQTSHRSTPTAVPETTEKTVEMTSPPTTLTPTQLLMSEAPQTPSHLSVAPPQQDEPPQLDVGDEDTIHEGHHASPLDPILAGLVSVFIVCTAIGSVMLFLKFRNRHEHPEFHRLHDLPMDDLLEDTPLSRYTY